jgi:hypothetical protein
VVPDIEKKPFLAVQVVPCSKFYVDSFHDKHSS